MSTRSYSGLIILEAIFDYLPTNNGDLTSFANTIFSPSVEVVEDDCMTSLGELSNVNYSLEGKVELSTGNIISKDRIEQLLSGGNYTVATRSLSTCISKGGICRSCYKASRQYNSVPSVGSSVVIQPEYNIAVDYLPLTLGTTSVGLTQDASEYDIAYVYNQGVLLPPSTYSITDSTLTLNNPFSITTELTIRYNTIIRAPFMSWLAQTYSGSILGIKALPSPLLPIKKRLLADLVPKSVLEYLSSNISSLKGIPTEVVEYLSKVKDPLEKSLLIIALYGVYMNVN